MEAVSPSRFSVRAKFRTTLSYHTAEMAAGADLEAREAREGQVDMAAMGGSEQIADVTPTTACAQEMAGRGVRGGNGGQGGPGGQGGTGGIGGIGGDITLH